VSQQPRPDRPLQPIVRRNLGSDVYGVLWDRILSRDLSPNEKLSDLRLSEELGVSRTPVREALHRLVQDGVVIYSPNRGFFVASFSADDIGEIFDLRAVLETLALRTVAARLQPAAFESAREDLDRVEALIAGASTAEDRHDAASAFWKSIKGFTNGSSRAQATSA
jgi:DNA-binding GntR family transcriptional regulator